MTHDIGKLPVWARNEIQRLQANEADFDQKLSDMLGHGEHAISNVLMPYFKAEMHDQYLPRNQLVHFQLPHPWAETRPGHIGVRHLRERDAIDIQGSQPIVIEPTAANCCTITFRER